MMINEENARIINKINQINLDQRRKRRYCGEYLEKFKIKSTKATKSTLINTETQVLWRIFGRKIKLNFFKPKATRKEASK